ncbi:ABC transporter permease subunit [Fimbriiglobus ruber]|uniref:Putative transmembrane protein n=1 Tax=Fimbriiglobus ruber TaxID=1908690 RepID=A0A225DX92_9BACT|nr:ABC transporter permease subunit [Fimbriiglobus ruber]OWK42316.1 putative transmembrane protein [Fimbriiglobus ruber]
MTLVLVRKLLRDVRWGLFAVCLLLFVFSAFWVKIAQRVTTEIAPFFNGVAAVSKINPKLFDEVIFKGPGKVSQAVLGGAEIRFDRPDDFLSVELLHPVVVIVTALWAVSRSSGAVAGEIDRGTMELLLSQPIPRNRLILAHLIVDAVTIPALVLSIVAGTQLGLALIGPFEVDYSVLQKLDLPPMVRLPAGPPVLEVHAARQWYAVVNLAALVFALSGTTMLVSALGRNRWRAVAAAGLIVIGMFVANVIGQLWDSAAFVRPVTVFYYYQPQKIWLKENWTVDLGEAWAGGSPMVEIPVMPVLIGVGAIGYLLALRVFDRRDLPAPL